MRIQYLQKRFSTNSMFVIEKANEICASYQRQGYDLTLRQLYYQFVSRDLIPNNQREYKKLGAVINNARLAGMLDWDYIVDRTRNISVPPSWNGPADIVHAAASSYRVDRWKGQPYKVEVWVEKDALGGVISRAAEQYRVPWFSCRGYTSQSEIWGAAQRLRKYIRAGQVPVILHLGDHDPSGIDMTRDIEERIRMFLHQDWLNDDMLMAKESSLAGIRESMLRHIERSQHTFPIAVDELPVIVNRIALNMDQVEAYDPPPNPTKFTDSRAQAYIAEHGYESWELDALEPQVLDQLINDTVEHYLDEDKYYARVEIEDAARAELRQVAEDFENRGDEEE